MAKSKLNFENPLFTAPEPTEREKGKAGRPRKTGIIRNEDGGQSAQEGLTEENTRFSCIMKVENVEFIRNYAFTKRLKIYEAMNEIIETYAEQYTNNPENEKIINRKDKK